ncbi:MAG: dihydroorotase [Deltaproteobacteria bacterium]|nr:dihydroorotase [Deltaproteobacteria bacterium]
MNPDRVFSNGTIVTSSSRFTGDIGIKNGKICFISEVSDHHNTSEVIDVTGKYVLPGLIDAHVHFQDPGITHREDIEHGSAAAAVGGITTCISHPLNIPPAVDVTSYKETLACYQGRAVVDYALHGGGTASNLEEISNLWRNTGATSLKAFMCFSVAEFPFVQDDSMFVILEKLAAESGVAIIHAESDRLTSLLEERLKKAGRRDPRAHVDSRPVMVEVEAVNRAIFLLEQTGASAVILHVSSVEALSLINDAKQRGVNVYAETCPHFLTFNETDIDRHGPYLKFTPVMRNEENRRQLWESIAEGMIDTIGSDHCPYTVEEKERGKDDIWRAPNGLPGLETLLPVLLNGVNDGLISLEKVVEITSAKPAKIYGLAPLKGEITPNSDADLTIVDMEKEQKYDAEKGPSKCSWSPYEGMTFRGWPVITVVRGEIVAADGEVKVEPGYGDYVPRQDSR